MVQVLSGWRSDDEYRRMEGWRSVTAAEERGRPAGRWAAKGRWGGGGGGALGRRTVETEGRLGGRRAAGVLMMVADLFGAAGLFLLYDESAARKVMGGWERHAAPVISV